MGECWYERVLVWESVDVGEYWVGECWYGRVLVWECRCGKVLVWESVGTSVSEEHGGGEGSAGDPLQPILRAMTMIKILTMIN